MLRLEYILCTTEMQKNVKSKRNAKRTKENKKYERKK